MSAGHFAPEVIGPSFDTLGGEVQQPGTSRPGATEPGDSRPRTDPVDKHRPAKVQLSPATKYAVRQVLVDNTKSYQLLPQDMKRKRALIRLPLLAVVQSTQVDNPANPGADSNFVAVVNANNAAQIQAVQFTLTTSAVVANRLAAITIDGVTYTAGVAQTASLVETYTFMPGAALTTVLPATGGQLTAPIPPGLIVPAGGAISSAVTGMQAGDQISAISIAYLPLSNTASNVVIGPEPVTDSGQGFPLLQGDPWYEYTAGSPLFCKGVSATPLQVNLLVETFEGTAAVN